MLGVYDEAADLVERAEKILYFYPPDTPPEVQLSLVDTCEGVIDVTRCGLGASFVWRFQECLRGWGVWIRVRRCIRRHNTQSERSQANR